MKNLNYDEKHFSIKNIVISQNGCKFLQEVPEEFRVSTSK
jgi:hypothetical protein|tara:strand:+ start:1435 stop:1554 length:120 start_codon:yes stop_codon:yes gene_type:complete